MPFQNVLIVFSTDSVHACDSAGAAAFAGDGSVSSYILVSADISELPNDILTMDSATLSARQVGVGGTPFGAQNLGLLRAYHMNVTPPTAATWAAPPLRQLGVFSASDEPSVRSIDIIDPFLEDWAQRTPRGNHSQYQLSFDRTNDNNGMSDMVLYDCNSFMLTTRYATP